MNICEDTFSCIIKCLDSRTIDNLRTTSKYNKKFIEKNKYIYKKIILIETWESEIIIEILEKTGVNLKKDIGNYSDLTLESVQDVMGKYYDCIKEEKIKFTNNTFICIYDIVFVFLSRTHLNGYLETSNILYQQREEFIRVNEIHEGSICYKRISNPTLYIDRIMERYNYIV